MLNYPNTPTNGQVFNTWKYDGVKWGPGAPIISVPDAPSNGITFGRNNGLWQDITATTGPLYVAKSGDTMIGPLIAGNYPGVGYVKLNPGDASNPGYVEFGPPGNVGRAGYIGWTSDVANWLAMEVESGWIGYRVQGSFSVAGNFFADNSAYVTGRLYVNGDMFLANEGDRFINWTSDGWKLLWQGSTGNLIHINQAGAWLAYFEGGGILNTPGVRCMGFSGSYLSFGWNGRIQFWVDGGNAYVELRDTRDYTPNQNVDVNNSPTFGDVYCNGTYFGQNGNAIHRFSAAEFTGTVQVNGDTNCNNWGRFAWVATRAREETPWGFSGYGGGGWYAVNGWGGSYGPLGWNGRRAYSNEAPVSIDCLNVIRAIELSQFKYDDVNEDVAVGFHSERMREILPALTHDKPQQWDDTWEFGYPVNTNAVLALLLGAVKQLDARMGVQ